jgi:predicted lipid-binding transport protein (Tim44 family)
VDNLPLIDILIFAVIAILLALRLRSVLGQRTGFEQPQEKNVKESFIDKDNAPIPFPKAVDKNKTISESGLDELRRLDSQFDETVFIQGATAAFKMILASYADGDQAQLRRLLGYDLLQSFLQSINTRSVDKETLEINIIEIREVRILNVELLDSVASITVHFHTVQARIARDINDTIIDESETEPREFIDIWTFERDLTISDPNWKLAETETADDDT